MSILWMAALDQRSKLTISLIKAVIDTHRGWMVAGVDSETATMRQTPARKHTRGGFFLHIIWYRRGSTFRGDVPSDGE